MSYFIPFSITKENTTLNGNLEIWLTKGKIILNTKNANYAFGRLHRLFQIVFKKLKIKDMNPKEVLILGFGVGSIASIIRRELKLNSHITGVEHDETLLALGDKYFKTLDLKVDLHMMDAIDFVKSSKKQFDLIAIDLFEDNEVPNKFLTIEFLDLCCNLLSPNGILVFNTIEDNKKQKSQLLLQHLKNSWKAGRAQLLTPFDKNKVLIWERFS